MGTADVMAKVAADIHQFGWHCMSVAPRRGEEGSIWSYTVGLCETFDHPEIAIFGLAAKTAHGILYDCVEAIRLGQRYPLDTPVEGVVAGDYRVEFRLVRSEHIGAFFGAATRYYGARPFRVAVMFWPTKERQFPWQTSEVTGQEEAVHVV